MDMALVSRWMFLNSLSVLEKRKRQTETETEFESQIDQTQH